MAPMKKRLLVTFTWFYGAWTAAAGTAFVFGWNEAIGPVVAIAAGLIVWFDPKHALWTRVADAPDREPAGTREPVGA